MRRIELIHELKKWDDGGREVFTISDLMKVTRSESPDVLSNALWRDNKTEKPILKRVLPGVYIFTLSSRPRTHTAETIARTLRRGSHCYVSLESALSEYGRISQIPVGRLTVMTTGRSGTFETNGFGTIELTHTDRVQEQFAGDLVNVGRPLRLASEQLALADLRRVGRNLHMIQPAEDLEEAIAYEA